MTRRLTTSIVALATALGGILLFLGMADSARAEEVTADMTSNTYAPGDLTISVGDTVTWTNSDSVPHTVTSDDGGPLDSGIIDGGESWSYTFTEPGTYSFYCEVHPNMRGTVTVVEQSSPPSTAPPTTDPGHGGHPTTTVPGEEPPPTVPPTTGTPPEEEEPSCTSAVAASVTPFWAHFQAAHLQTSPGDQVGDATDVSGYTLAHTALFDAMLDPLVATALAAMGGVDPFWVHFQTAHLQTSPGDQVADASDVDGYTLAHTALIGSMASPGVDPLVGSC